MKEVITSRILRTIPLLIAVCLLSFPAQAQYGGGSGEPNNPYLIYTAEQMNEIGLHEEDWDKHSKLMADIDLSSYAGTDFNIIGYYGTYKIPFTGVFDGSGKKISNFSYTSTDTSSVGHPEATCFILQKRYSRRKFIPQVGSDCQPFCDFSDFNTAIEFNPKFMPTDSA